MRAGIALVFALAAGSAAAETRGFEWVGCPEGYTPQWRSIDLQDAIAPYHAQAGDVPAPAVKPRKPRFARAARRDPDFPRSGKAYAIVLVSERGRVDDVLVHCATSAKLVAPMVAAWRGARVGAATRDGKPVRTAFVVEAQF
jgi:hypothetical protein